MNLGNNFGLGICLNNLGNIHYKNQRFEEAVQCYSKAVELAESHLNSICCNLRDCGFERQEFRLDGDFKKLLLISSNRTFMLANALYAYEEQQMTYYFQNALDNLSHCELNYLELGLKTRAMKSKIIKVNILISSCEFDEAFEKLNELEIEIDNTIISESTFEPRDVILQTILCLKGVALKKTGKYKDAAISFTKSLENVECYCPYEKKRALTNLYDIFLRFNIDVEPIVYLLSKFSPCIKDIVFLMDISESMKGHKIVNSLRNILHVFDEFVGPEDRVSYMLFNEKVHTMFPLTKKSHSESSLRNIMEKIPM